MQKKVPNFLLKRSELAPNKVAFVFRDRRYTYKELFMLADVHARRISSFIKKDDFVAVLMENHERMIFNLLALQMIGARAVLLNTRLTVPEIQYQMKDAQVKALLVSNKFEHILTELQELEDTIYFANVEKPLQLADYELQKEIELDAICSIMFTSGTTGFPKGVKQTFGNHFYSAMNSTLNIGLTSEDSWLCAVPMFHISGYSILMRSIIYGMKMVLVEKFDENIAIELIKNEKITMMSVVSTMLIRMEEVIHKDELPSYFRCMLLGGGPASLHLLEKCKEKNIPVFQSYGMTETCSQIVTLAPEDSLEKLGSSGKALFTSQVKIIDDLGNECLSNIAGEILVKGPNVTSGYLNKLEANNEKFKDDWLMTGDIGYLDNDGYLYVLDRRTDLIISGGENIYPAEIEGVLAKHEAILEAGVVGKKDERWSEVPLAFVVLKKNVTEEELSEHCHQYLAKYKCPVQFITLSELPRNASNKLLRKELKKYITD